MDPLLPFLAHIWFVFVGLMLVLYVTLDGANLGVGILSLFEHDQRRKGYMIAALGSTWDANATWLVVLGGALFGAFPLVYSVVLNALYIPLAFMLFGLIFRTVAFEYSSEAIRKRRWALAFGFGSLLAAVCQGFALGGLLGGVKVVNGHFAGGPLDWINPFALLAAVGVVFGYALLGATYLILKTEGEVQQAAYRRARRAGVLMLLAAIGVTIATPLSYRYILAKWLAFPNDFYLAPLPIAAFLAFLMLWRSLKRGYERTPYLWTNLIFLLSFIGLALSVWPNIIPPNVSIVAAAASPRTLAFMLVGVGLLVPIMIVYNGYQYLVFRGKVPEEYGGHDH